MFNHTLVVDIETIKGNNYEIAMAPFIQSLVGKTTRSNKRATSLSSFVEETDDKYELALRKCALSPIGGRIACIGVYETGIQEMFQDTNEEKWHFIYDSNEAIMLQRFKSLIKPTTQLVTFNGRSFDFPFLMFRAAIHGIDLNLDIKPYNGKNFNGNDHIDLKQHLEQVSNVGVFGSDWSITSVSLKKWIEYFQLGTKLSIKDGEISIDKLIEQGKIFKKDYDEESLEFYSENDVLLTYALWKRFKRNFI